MKNINLDFTDLQSKLKIKQEKGKRFIFCLIRQKYLVITPEEIVRQLFLLYLIELKAYPKNRIAVEKQLDINGRKKRFDILILNKEVQPIVLVECKAPNVAISQLTFNQITQYNLTLNADLLIVTNGEMTFCCTMNHIEKTYDFLEEIPFYE
jgi:hypothetical protein